MILVIDTSSKKSLALQISKKNIKKDIWEANFSHSEKLLPRIKKLIGKSGLEKMSGLGIVTGPGSYTGLRVGAAVANSLGYALNIPLIEINKFEWLALLALTDSFPLEKSMQICAVVPAIHDQVFAGIYKIKKNKVKFGLEEPKGFFAGNIKELCQAIKGPTFFTAENSNGMRNIINKKILKKYIRNNFLNIKYYNLYGEASVKVLARAASDKMDGKDYKKIVHPLYVKKANIT